MAGFFGLFDYSKPGPGVRKDEPEKPRFIQFWALFVRKFWKLVQLNLLYLLFCLPVVTIGAANAGMTYVLRNMANEQPVFLFSDFWDAFRANWKQSTVYYLLMAACGFLLIVSAQFYLANTETYRWMFLPAALTIFMGLLLILMSFYTTLMIVTLELPLRSILKNAAILAILCVKTNLLTLLFTFLILLAVFLFFPPTLLLVLLIVPAWIGFIVCFNSYPGIHKYAIEPYLAAQAEAAEQAETPPPDATVFRDEPEIPNL